MNYPRKLAVIVGAMKCGTTSLYDYLKTHPEVCGGRVKESNFFLQPLRNRSLIAYRSLFPKWARPHQLALDGSTNYAKHHLFPGAPANMATFARDHSIDIRILYVVRDPYEAIESFYRHALTNPAPWAQKIQLPVDQVPKRALDTWAFASQIDQFLKYCSRDRLRVVTNDQLRDWSSTDSGRDESPGKGWMDLCQFLGIKQIGFKEKKLSNTSTSRIRKGRTSIAERGLMADDILRWRLPLRARECIRTALASDINRLRDEHDVDVSRWETARDLRLC